MRSKVSIILSVLMIVSMFGNLTASAETNMYSDTAGHWAEKEIQKWSSLDILKGNNGAFDPDKNITRAEMAVIIDRLMKYEYQSKNIFLDLTNTWYTEAILKNNAAGIMLGSKGNLRPNDYVTREEAVVMIARALGTDEQEGKTSFPDDSEISSWAKSLVKAFKNKGYINGLLNGNFAPKANITRASVIKIIDNAVTSLIKEPATLSETLNGTTIVNCANVKFKDAKVEGDLIIAEGVGDGEVYLDNVNIAGNIIVRGGGEESIYLNNCTVEGNLVVKKQDGKIRIVASGKTEVKVTTLKSGAMLVEQELEGDGFKSVVIPEEATKNSEMLFDGNFNNIEVSAEDTSIKVEGTVSSLKLKEGVSNLVVDGTGTINEVDVIASAVEFTVKENAKITEISIDAKNTNINCEGTIKNVVVNKNAEGFMIEGTGTVTDVKVNANNVKINTNGTKVKVADNVTGVTAGDKDLEAGQTVEVGDPSSPSQPSSGGSNGGSSNGDNNSSVTIPTSVVVDTNSVPASMKIGETHQLTATVYPTNATNKTVTWSSSDETVATVTTNGAVTAVSAGEATITVTTNNGGKTATCVIKVVSDVVVVTPTAVTLDKTSLTMNVDDTYQLKAIVEPNGATDKTVTWSSDNEGIAKVDSDGKVTAVSVGEAKITVTTNSGEITATCIVKVVSGVAEVIPTAVTLNTNSLDMNVDDTYQLKAIVEPNGATDKTVTWSSDNEDVATVDTEGIITALSAGEATITVTTNSGGETATCVIKVVSDVVVVTPTAVTLDTNSLDMNVDDTYQLKATIEPYGATDKTVTWSSDNEGVAKVDSDGKVTAVSAGEATITVTTNSGGKIDTCAVTVSEIQESGISFTTTEGAISVKQVEVFKTTDSVIGVTTGSVVGLEVKADGVKEFTSQYTVQYTTESAITIVTGLVVNAESNAGQKNWSIKVTDGKIVLEKLVAEQHQDNITAVVTTTQSSITLDRIDEECVGVSQEYTVSFSGSTKATTSEVTAIFNDGTEYLLKVPIDQITSAHKLAELLTSIEVDGWTVTNVGADLIFTADNPSENKEITFNLICD